MLTISNIETDIADHCNLACSHCSHHSPFIRPSFYQLEEFERDINILKNYVRCDWFKILGGEPLLNRNFKQYIDAIRRSNISDNIALFTNGVLLDKIDHASLDELDCLYVSIYPTKYQKRVIESIQRIKNSMPGLVIHTRYVDTFEAQEFLAKNTNEKLVNRIWNACKIRYECNAVYRGYFIKCMTSYRKEQFLKRVGQSSDELNKDSYGCSLVGPELKTRLFNYIFSNTPLTSCSWCVGSCGKDVKHEQRSDLINIPATVNDVLDFDKLGKPHEVYLKPPSIFTRQAGYKTYVDIDGITHTPFQDIS